MTTEMKSPPRPRPAPSVGQDLDPQSMAAIRNLMAAEPQEPDPAAPVQQEAVAAPHVPAAETAPNRPDQGPIEPSQVAQAENGPIARIKAKVMAYRPTPRHLIWGSVGLLVLLRPWLVLLILFFSLFVFVGVFLILGYDGFWKRAMAIGRWYAGRRPARAAELHRKLDAFAVRWDSILDRFPEGTVDGLYLPDFGEMATAEARHDAALDRRLADLQRGKA